MDNHVLARTGRRNHGRAGSASRLSADEHARSGLLSATLYRDGSPTDHFLVASFTLDQDLVTYDVTGQFGASSGQSTYAIETAGVCPAA